MSDRNLGVGIYRKKADDKNNNTLKQNCPQINKKAQKYKYMYPSELVCIQAYTKKQIANVRQTQNTKIEKSLFF